MQTGSWCPFIAHYRDLGENTPGDIAPYACCVHIFFPENLLLVTLGDHTVIFRFVQEHESWKKKLVLEKMGNNKQKGKISVSHEKEMFERQMKTDADGQKSRLWQETEWKTGRQEFATREKGLIYESRDFKEWWMNKW